MMNFNLRTSSPIEGEGLPSPKLTEPSLSSPKNESTGTENIVISPSNPLPNTDMSTSTFKIPTPIPTPSTSNTSASPILSAMLRSLPKPSKELNITEYSNKELKSMKKRCRTVMTPAQSRILRKVLEQTAFPSTEIRENLAKILGMKPRTVQIWFQNQRQKSRQGRSSEDLTSIMGSPNESNSDGNGTDIEDPLSSPMDTSSNNGTSNSTSPGFNALTAAAFALSNTTAPLEIPPNATTPPSSTEQQRYTTFHGAVYKSIPGCMPMNIYRGNTAAAINAKRIATAAAQNIHQYPQFMHHQQQQQQQQQQQIQQGQTFIPGSAQPGFQIQSLPSQPQKIPSYNISNGYRHPGTNVTTRAGEAIPLDILASAVSNFRPNGYNYYMQPPPSNRVPQLISPNLQVNRNRLAPLRTPSPPAPNFETKLPSLKALAQVASIGMEQLESQGQIQHVPQHNAQQVRSKSLTEISPTSPVKIIRRFSAEISPSTSASSTFNISAPNNSSSTAALRRPW